MGSVSTLYFNVCSVGTDSFMFINAALAPVCLCWRPSLSVFISPQLDTICVCSHFQTTSLCLSFLSSSSRRSVSLLDCLISFMSLETVHTVQRRSRLCFLALLVCLLMFSSEVCLSKQTWVMFGFISIWEPGYYNKWTLTDIKCTDTQAVGLKNVKHTSTLVLKCNNTSLSAVSVEQSIDSHQYWWTAAAVLWVFAHVCSVKRTVLQCKCYSLHAEVSVMFFVSPKGSLFVSIHVWTVIKSCDPSCCRAQIKPWFAVLKTSAAQMCEE